ncbi:MAG: hypothetical protein RSD18_04860 [Anaerovoracaceae bacterium]
MDYSNIDLLLNTTQGMDTLADNTKKDESTISVTGVGWFQFNGVAANTLYASGNHWMGIGASAEHLKVCRRDGAMYYLYRQEGTLYNYYKFLKIRWEGYTQYSSTDASCKLVYELFLFNTGDMFLNVIQTPTSSSYIGTSQLVCGSNTYTLDIPISSVPMITFTKGDGQGKTWVVTYDKINIQPPFECKYLVQDSTGYYTMLNGALRLVPITTLNAQTFRDYGINASAFQADLIKALQNPKVLYWQDSNLELPKKQVSVQAIPPIQVIYSGECDLKDASIKGIKSATAGCFDDVTFQITFDGRKSWWVYNTVWQAAQGDAGGMTKSQIEAINEAAWMEAWAMATAGKYEWKIVFPSVNSYLDYIKLDYRN